MTLSSKKIDALLPKERRYVVSDGHGLTLRVHPTGNKSWTLRLSVCGRTSDISLGKYPEVSLKQARQLARRKRKEFDLKPPHGYVFNDAFKLWCNLKKGRIVSYKDERRMLERFVLPRLKNIQLDEINAPIIIHLMKPLEKQGLLVTLKRLLMRCREILDLAVCAGYILHNPINRVSRVFASPTVTPMPAVHWKLLPEVMGVISLAPKRIQIIFLWSLCSMLRPSETSNLRWSWIKGDTLVIPADEMKKGREHRVPLTPAMVKLLYAYKEVSSHQKSDFIFTGRSAKPMSSQTLAKYLHQTELKGKLVAHGLRTIARSWMADHGYPFEASEACLSHVVGSRVSRAYQRSDYLDIRRQIMADWCDHVLDCAKSAQISIDLS